MASQPNLPGFTWDRPQRIAVRVEAKMEFQRRHLEHIADGIKTAPVDDATRAVLANHFATHLAGTNDNFNRDRFVKACK
jgi:hypothetical protein